MKQELRSASTPAVLMVVENCGYPLDARVRMEAESLVALGLSVEVLAPLEAGLPRAEEVRGVKVTRIAIPDGHGKLLPTLIEYVVASLTITRLVLARLLRSRRGVLHVHNPPDVFFPLLYLARRRGWATVFDHHDDAAGLLATKLGRTSALSSLLTFLCECSARSADLTIVTNDTQCRSLEPTARNIAIVRNGPPIWFSEFRAQPPHGRARLVFLGEIGEQDGVERSVEVLASLVDDHHLDIELLIIGDGPCREKVEARARSLSVNDRLTVTGWVSFEEVPRLLATAHIGLDTAPPTPVNHASTMVKVLEYLAVGLPVVATDLRETRVTGADAVITVEDAASVQAFTAPIVGLLSSPETWRQWAARARARGTELQWPAQQEILTRAYQHLLGADLPAEGWPAVGDDVAATSQHLTAR